MFDGIGRAIAVLFWAFVLFFVLTIALSGYLVFSPKPSPDRSAFEQEAVEAGVGKIERVWRPETGWRTEFRFRSPENEYKQGKLDGYRDAMLELRQSGELVPVPKKGE